jgi:hypothetical protein
LSLGKQETMSDNELSAAKEIEFSPEAKQHSKSPAEVFASFIIYLMAGMIVMVIMLLVYLYG